ncbi:helix-turn-helix domain-containing protein [Actinomadura litoris]|uniref:Helix-turn-helix domain-containing protein n=1 Tax=Actinomadura litoris TaxID=2678616 RepID=A0A7K1KSI3_9ACTN|nr:helix-turn-helix transcriptional regulator [Actinomadura litoris]MUN35119.1 helix-turn-helix domain-containing protein [Actinomadura litoris]
MSMTDEVDPRSSLWGLIGFYLRFLRTSKGLTGAEAGKIAGCAPSTISRIETGAQLMSTKHAARLDEAWRTGGLFTLLIYYAVRATTPDWFQSYLSHEQGADRVRMFAGQYVPGLFQTPEYAQALLAEGRAKDKKAALERRMARQEILSRPNPPEVWVIIAQTVLEWPVGGKNVFKAQLARLLSLSEQPNISIRVVPGTAGAYEGMDGPFMITTGREGEIAFAEAPNAGRLVAHLEEVNDFVIRFDRIGMLALPVGPSRDLIKKNMEQMT